MVIINSSAKLYNVIMQITYSSNYNPLIIKYLEL